MNLFIDTTNEKYVKIATFTDTFNDFKESQIAHDKNLAEIFVDKVNEHFNKYDLTIDNIKKIYVVKGPGTFTGVKIGTVFANTIKSIHKDVRLFEINSCDIRYNATKEVIAIDAKSNLSYATVYLFGEKSGLILAKNEDIERFCKKRNISLLKDKEYQTSSALTFNLDYFDEVERVIPLYVKKAV